MPESVTPGFDERPIGIFDSGVGGLTIWKAIRRLLPCESIDYVADQAEFPYGAKTEAELQARTEVIAGSLVELGVKLIVVGCNTASVRTLANLRERYPDVPFVGVVPVIRTLGRYTRTGTIAVLCTSSTAQSPYIYDLAARFAADRRLVVIDGSGLETLIEQGQSRSPETKALLERLLGPVGESGADVLGLGCTHYPLVRRTIKDIVGPSVRVYEPSRPVARRVRSLLRQSGALAGGPPRHRFFTSGEPLRFTEALRQLAGLREPSARALAVTVELPPH